jgi:hypothetical protein
MKLVSGMAMPAKGGQRMDAISTGLALNFMRLVQEGYAPATAWRTACNRLRCSMMRYQQQKQERSASAMRQSNRNFVKAMNEAIMKIQGFDRERDVSLLTKIVRKVTGRAAPKFVPVWE